MHRDSNKEWTKSKLNFREKIFQGDETIKPENKNLILEEGGKHEKKELGAGQME